jgi:hypothetical protein
MFPCEIRSCLVTELTQMKTGLGQSAMDCLPIFGFSETLLNAIQRAHTHLALTPKP